MRHIQRFDSLDHLKGFMDVVYGGTSTMTYIRKFKTEDGTQLALYMIGTKPNQVPVHVKL